MISKKIVLIGDFSTGKTSLIRRYVDNQFSDIYLSTLGVKISRKNISFAQHELQALIWDVEGGTQTKPINQSYLRGAHGCIIAVDISREQTLSNIDKYIAMMQNISLELPMVLAMNKADLISREDSQKLLERITEQHSELRHVFLTSAKSGEGVERMFEALARTLLP